MSQARSNSRASLAPTIGGGFGVAAPDDGGRARMTREEILSRPEIATLQEIVPGVDKAVLGEILKGNNFDLEASIDAALALSASLEAEQGRPVLNSRDGSRLDSAPAAQESREFSNITLHSPTQQRRNTVASSTPSTTPTGASSNNNSNASHRRSVLNARAAEIQELIGPNGVLNPSQGVVTSKPSAVTVSSANTSPRQQQQQELHKQRSVDSATGTAKGGIKAYVDRNYMRDHSLFRQRSKRGADVILPPSFLCAPRYHVTIDKCTDCAINYSVTFRRMPRTRLGIHLLEINGDVVVQHLYHTDNSLQESGSGSGGGSNNNSNNENLNEPLLALEAGVRVGDLLIGMNDDYFSPGPEVHDIVDMLQLEGSIITLHFTRNIHLLTALDPGDSFVPHKFAQILADQGVITSDALRWVSRALVYQQHRILCWDTDTISKRILRWHLSGLTTSSSSASAVTNLINNMNNHHYGNNNSGSSSVLFNPFMSTGSDSSGSSSSVGDNSIARANSLTTSAAAASVRPALSIRIMRAEQKRDHVVYVMWVMDVLSGAEWVVQRRFKEFLEFRDMLASIRQSIGRVPFPAKRLNVAETNTWSMISERLTLLQKFLRHVCSLVTVNTLHPSSIRLQLLLQQFLSVDERINTINLLERSPQIPWRNVVQSYVYGVMQMKVMDKVLYGFVEGFTHEGWEEEVEALQHQQRPFLVQQQQYHQYLQQQQQRGASVKLHPHSPSSPGSSGSLSPPRLIQQQLGRALELLEGVQVFMDQLQSVVSEGVMHDSMCLLGEFLLRSPAPNKTLVSLLRRSTTLEEEEQAAAAAKQEHAPKKQEQQQKEVDVEKSPLSPQLQDGIELRDLTATEQSIWQAAAAQSHAPEDVVPLGQGPEPPTPPREVTSAEEVEEEEESKEEEEESKDHLDNLPAVSVTKRQWHRESDVDSDDELSLRNTAAGMRPAECNISNPVDETPRTDCSSDALTGGRASSTATDDLYLRNTELLEHLQARGGGSDEVELDTFSSSLHHPSHGSSGGGSGNTTSRLSVGSNLSTSDLLDESAAHPPEETERLPPPRQMSKAMYRNQDRFSVSQPEVSVKDKTTGPSQSESTTTATAEADAANNNNSMGGNVLNISKLTPEMVRATLSNKGQGLVDQKGAGLSPLKAPTTPTTRHQETGNTTATTTPTEKSTVKSPKDASAGTSAIKREQMVALAEDEMRTIVRDAIRRQIEIEIYVAVALRLRSNLEVAHTHAERELNFKRQQFRSKPQSFYGIAVEHTSPSNWSEVVYALSNIRTHTLPLDRLQCLLDCAKSIPNVFAKEHPDFRKPLGADDFLPIFIYVLVHVNIPHLLALNAELQYLCDKERRMSEVGYYLATLEASLTHISEGDPEIGWAHTNNNHSNSTSNRPSQFRMRGASLSASEDSYDTADTSSSVGGGGGGMMAASSSTVSLQGSTPRSPTTMQHLTGKPQLRQPQQGMMMQGGFDIDSENDDGDSPIPSPQTRPTPSQHNHKHQTQHLRPQAESAAAAAEDSINADDEEGLRFRTSDALFERPTSIISSSGTTGATTTSQLQNNTYSLTQALMNDNNNGRKELPQLQAKRERTTRRTIKPSSPSTTSTTRSTRAAPHAHASRDDHDVDDENVATDEQELKHDDGEDDDNDNDDEEHEEDSDPDDWKQWEEK